MTHAHRLPAVCCVSIRKRIGCNSVTRCLQSLRMFDPSSIIKELLARIAFFIREIAGLINGALREHLRAVFGVHQGLLIPARRFTMRNEFRFPKSTAVLMMIILAGIILALEKARLIQASYAEGNPVVPMEASHLTFFPTLALLLAIFYAAGLVGWAILFALRRSGVHRLADISGEPK